jgi:hypothetical protein
VGIPEPFHLFSSRKGLHSPKASFLCKADEGKHCGGNGQGNRGGSYATHPGRLPMSRFRADGLKRIQFRKEVMAVSIHFFVPGSTVPNINKEKEK